MEYTDIHFRMLDESQRSAIVAYAASEGRCWKRALRRAWMYCDYRGHEAYANTLQAIRNSFGAAWLHHVRIR